MLRNCRICEYIFMFREKDSALHSSPPNATYMRQWIGSALVQIMGCCLCIVKPLSKPVLVYCQLDPEEQTSVKINQNTKHFIHGNASGNIFWEMAAILSRGRWVNTEQWAYGGLHVRDFHGFSSGAPDLQSQIWQLLADGMVLFHIRADSRFAPANERRCYKGTPSLIGWVQT